MAKKPTASKGSSGKKPTITYKPSNKPTTNKYNPTYVETDPNRETINKAQHLLQYGNLDNYVPGAAIDNKYWATGGGNGKNTLFGNNTGKYYGQKFTIKDIQAMQGVVSGYEDYLAEQARAEERKKQEAFLGQIYGYFGGIQAQQNAALEAAKQANANQINSAHNMSARDYYRLYKTQQAQLPENLSRAGVTGGASESSQLKLLNAYSDNMYQNETNRNNLLASNDASYNDKVAQNSMNLSSQLGNFYLQGLSQMAAWDREDKIRKEERQLEAQQKAEAAAAQSALVAKNNDTRKREAERQRQGYNTIHWTDENGVYHYQINGKKNTKGSGKGKSAERTYNLPQGPSSSSGGGDTVKSVLQGAQLRLSMPSVMGFPNNDRINSGLNGAQGALEYIRSSTLTEAQKKQVAKQLGLL